MSYYIKCYFAQNPENHIYASSQVRWLAQLRLFSLLLIPERIHAPRSGKVRKSWKERQRKRSQKVLESSRKLWRKSDGREQDNFGNSVLYDRWVPEQEIGSLSGAAFIVAGVYIIAAIVLILLRKRLFVNIFTNLFSGIIEEESPSDNWKTLLLMFVKNLRGNLDLLLAKAKNKKAYHQDQK